MAEDEILLEVDSGVAVFTLNRPERLNALTDNMLDDLRQRLESAAQSPEIGCVVIRGAGRAFCAGGDVKNQATRLPLGPETADLRFSILRRRMEISSLLHLMPKPTIAMLNGAAAGAGFAIALACDMRFAAKGASGMTAFSKVALSGDFGATYFLEKLLGFAKARELFYTSERLDAGEMARLGLVNQLFPDDELEARTIEFARTLAAGPKTAWECIKRNMSITSGRLSDALDSEASGIIRCLSTADHREGARAFVERRPPVFGRPTGQFEG
jgi:2-(1,2-epoxy-1,2-dihydrophenyl)acetyl-CoA isomerase